MKGVNEMTQDQYKCSECGATFSNEMELEQHNRTMHARFTCEACGQTFSSQIELDAHNREVHPETQEAPTS
jgi:transposase-like protein